MRLPKKTESKEARPKSSVPIVDSLVTALGLLEYFSIREPEISLHQLSEKSGLYKSRVHRLCNSLVYASFLVRTPSASYRLGPKLMALGKIYENTNTLVSLSRPIMKDLANLTGESVALFSLEGETSFCLARELGSSRLVFSINEGDYMQLYASAAGRILLAYGSEALREKVLDSSQFEQFTPQTVIDSAKIKAELPVIRERGWALNRGERELEIAAVAAPIFDHDTSVNTALAVVGPAQRFSDDRIPGIVEKLADASRKISQLRGAPL